MRLDQKGIFIALAIIVSVPFGAFADTASDLANKIVDQNAAIRNLEKEIAGYQQQLTLLGQNKNTLANTIQTLNLESKKLNADIQVTEGKITAENLTLASLGTSIKKRETISTTSKLRLRKACMKCRLTTKILSQNSCL